MNWITTQTGTIELIYALIVYGVVNQGNIDIAELVTLCESVLQVDLKQSYHKFRGISTCKNDTAKFLTKLADALIRWISDKMGYSPPAGHPAGAASKCSAPERESPSSVCALQ